MPKEGVKITELIPNPKWSIGQLNWDAGSKIVVLSIEHSDHGWLHFMVPKTEGLNMGTQLIALSEDHSKETVQ